MTCHEADATLDDTLPLVLNALEDAGWVHRRAVELLMARLHQDHDYRASFLLGLQAYTLEKLCIDASEQRNARITAAVAQRYARESAEG